MGKFLIIVSLALLACFEAKAFPKDHGKTDETYIPAMARKAGGRLRPELVKSTTEVAKPIESDGDEGSKADDENAWYEYSESEEELDCRRGKYYHMRGKKCVPRRCPGKRNRLTGECIESSYETYGSSYHYSPWCGGVHRRSPVICRRSYITRRPRTVRG